MMNCRLHCRIFLKLQMLNANTLQRRFFLVNCIVMIIFSNAVILAMQYIFIVMFAT